MVFTHDTELALQAAVTLANSGLDPDTLTTQADLDRLWDDHEYSGRRDRTAAELDAVRAYEASNRKRRTILGKIDQISA